jgi:thioredoxin 1
MKILAFFTLCFASVVLAEDFRTIDGKEYKNVKVSRLEPDGIVLQTSTGIWKLYFTELPKEVQARFHYDPTNAASYSAQQVATQDAFQKQQHELRRKLAEEAQKTEQNRIRTAAAFAAARRQPVGQSIEVISHGAQVDIARHLALGNVTIVDFYADWCGPCRQISPVLEQMAQSDPEIALRKIDIVNWKTSVARQYNLHSIPQVQIYNRAGSLVGTVNGADTEQVRRYVAQAKAGG